MRHRNNRPWMFARAWLRLRLYRSATRHSLPPYCIDGQGMILDAKIVPPTSQNQKTIEGDLWKFVPKYLDLPVDKLRWQCEQAIRNYDPCISCATHFLKLKVERD